MSDEPDSVREVRKKPSAGLSYSRKLNTGQDYENEELELWATTGSVDQDSLESELSDLVDQVAEEMEERVKEIKARDGKIPREIRDKLEDVIRAMKNDGSERASEMLQELVRRDAE